MNLYSLKCFIFCRAAGPEESDEGKPPRDIDSEEDLIGELCAS
jgi:hypothetical protein